MTTEYNLLRRAKFLESMHDEQIATLSRLPLKRIYDKGSTLIQQGQVGREFFVMVSGEAAVVLQTEGGAQEHRRFQEGELFGELALLKKSPCAASVIAATDVEVLVVAQEQFERLFGPMDELASVSYPTDPRKVIADFYAKGDCRGPLGSLHLQGLVPDPSLGESSWFAVFRPTTRDAIAKMLSGVAVGRGPNVKGESSKQGILSGYVPFVQINDNVCKEMIEPSQPNARVTIYYKTSSAREKANQDLMTILEDCGSKLDIEDRSINMADDYVPKAFGIEMPQPLMHEAFITRQDLSSVEGWEIGLESDPASMNINLRTFGEVSEPRVVLYQLDDACAMNPRGLLIAYAEKFVKPVVSGFDAFTVGSKGMSYDPVPQDWAELALWALDRTAEIIKTPDHNPWPQRWLRILEAGGAKISQPKLPLYCFTDATSCRFIADLVSATAECGAVRGGAECCNLHFPHELDDEYLVVWDGWPSKPWDYMPEKDLRQFLIERARDGFAFPINPVWPLRDNGWSDVLQALQKSTDSKAVFDTWYPPEMQIIDKITALTQEHPEGFKVI